MVQLTPAVITEQAEVVSPAQSYLPLHHLPQTGLVSQTAPVGIVSPQPLLTMQEAPSGHQGHLTSTTTFLNSDLSSCPTLAGTTADLVSSFGNPFSTFTTMLDTLPVTVLGSETQSVITSADISALGSASGDAGKTFQVIPVTEAGFVVDNCAPASSAVTFSAESTDSLQQSGLTSSVDSLLESKGYGSDCSDVYMNSDYTDTVSSADSSAFLLSAGHSHRASTDSSEFLLSTHPESTSEFPLAPASQLNNEVSEPLLHTVSASDSSEHVIVNHEEDSALHHAPNVYSNDAFSEGHSTSNESLSQVLYSSDEAFCKSFPSTSSEALLQISGKEYTDEAFPGSKAQSEACTCNNNNNSSYETFSEALPLSNSCSEAHPEKEPMIAEAMGSNNLVTHCIMTVSPLWETPITEEDGSMAAEEKDDQDMDREERTTLILGSGEGGALEQLVSHLAEQHPQEVVDICIEVLDQPSPGPLDLLEPHWMQSTDSLHHYKLLKQGRCPNNTANPLHIHALSGLRANTMNNLHERSSFLNLTAASVTNLGQACQKALSYVRADMEFGSMMSLGRQQGGLGGMDLSGGDKKKDSGQATVASGCHTRNVLYMALLVTLLLIAVNTTRNLQSSLNQEGGVGIICLAAMFASYTLGSLLSPVLVQRQGVRVCVVAGLVLQLLYVAANLHATLWLMLPASLGGGASLALIWNAMSTYIVLLARGESNYNQKSYQRVADKFFGIFCLIYQSNLIIGNLIASLVLTFAGGQEGSDSSLLPLLLNDSAVNKTTTSFSAQLPELVTGVVGLVMGQVDNSTDYSSSSAWADNSSTLSGNMSSLLPWDSASSTHYHLCGSEFCHHFVLEQDSSSVPARTVYLLFGIFMFLVVTAILIAIFLLEPLVLPPSSSSTPVRPWHTIRVQFVSLLRFSTNVKFVLILPLLLYGTMQFSFVCSEVMMAYVTCPVGVWLVGYTMIGYGVSCSLGSYITQALVPRLGRGCFIAVAAGLNVGVLVFMRLWQPHPDSLLPLFVITALLGFTDGIWNVNANGLCGSMFPEHYEEAFTGLRIAQGLGGAFSMAYAPFLCMAVKIYIMIGTAVVVLVGYVGADVLIRRDEKMKKVELLFEKEVV